MTLPISDTLEELASRCEQATGPDRELSASIALAVHDWLHEVEGNKPLNCRVRNTLGSPVYIGGETGRGMDYTASLDAVMSLVPEGWMLSKLQQTPRGTYPEGVNDAPWGASLYIPKAPKRSKWLAHGLGQTAALALCAASLRARSAMERSK